MIVHNVKPEYSKAPKRETLAKVKQMGAVRCIGAGCYAKVYSNPSLSSVFKVGKVAGNEPYLAFVDEVLKRGQNNSHLPQIRQVRIIRGSGRHRDKAYFIVELEKLTKLSRNDNYQIAEDLDWALNNYQSTTMSARQIKKTVTGQLQKAMLLANKARGKTSSCWDLHVGNFMERDGVIVITDPLWEG